MFSVHKKTGHEINLPYYEKNFVLSIASLCTLCVHVLTVSICVPYFNDFLWDNVFSMISKQGRILWLLFAVES